MEHVVLNDANTPSLKFLQLFHQKTHGRFELDLPDLESMDLEYFHVSLTPTCW